MANSSYYYELYQKFKEKAKKYEKNIKELQPILDTLNNSFSGKQSDINKGIDSLSEDLNKAVRHDSEFTSIASRCNDYKEKSTSSDRNLSGAASAIESEISVLKEKKRDAEEKRDQYYKKYQEEKEKERQEAIDSFKSIFK